MHYSITNDTTFATRIRKDMVKTKYQLSKEAKEDAMLKEWEREIAKGGMRTAIIHRLQEKYGYFNKVTVYRILDRARQRRAENG